MSIQFADAGGGFSGFSIIYSELDPDDPDDATPTAVVCLHCLLEDGDAQLARGLDLAREHREAEYNPAAGEWFVSERH